MKAAGFFLFFSMSSLIMVNCLPSTASLGQDKKFLSNASLEEDEKFLNDASMKEDEKFLNDASMKEDEEFLNNASMKEDEKFLNDRNMKEDEEFLNDASMKEDEKFLNDTSMKEDDKFLNDASMEKDKKFLSNASLEEEEKIIRRQRSLDGDFLQVTQDGYGFELPFNPVKIYDGVFEINNIMSHVTQNLFNAFFSLTMWIIIGITKILFTDEDSFTFQLSDSGRQKRSAQDILHLITNFRVSEDGTSFTLPFNPPSIFNGVFQINNLLTHVGQNLINNGASIMMWAYIAAFDIIFGDGDKPFGFIHDYFEGDGGVNLGTIYTNVLTRDPVLIHASQNLINYIASFLGWMILAVFIV